MVHSIKIGICTGPDRLRDVAPGYDYAEMSVTGTLTPFESDATFEQRKPDLVALVPPIRSLNIFAPRELALTGPDVDWSKIENYTVTALRRAASLGVQVIVVGSGGSRRVPEGFSRALAWGQLVRFFGIAGEHAEQLGITMAIEPLNRRECNIINSYAEGVQLAKDVGCEAVRVLADIYHMQEEDEPLKAIGKAPEWLSHVHLADTGRLYPGSGQYPLRQLFALLKDIGYKGMASIECQWGVDFRKETSGALEFLKGLA